MAYSDTNLSNIESAIIALATGARKVRVTMGDKSIEYSDADLDKLRSLRSDMMAEQTNKANSRYFLITTGKGL
ncbi:gpW protein [Syntrophus gentianae]|uniref:GpW protein n=1 Tax=Syntrophus gentianae TaxID=43775 RepID=A0A1H8AW28_9BACT|nr:gpW family head-tail joining protein [Syntrophus gentianae]SEM74920.1 gpW protein [Syntrophus gentianae]